MEDYKELYHKMVNAAEDAIRILIAAQQECEERIISDKDTPPQLKIITLPKEDQE